MRLQTDICKDYFAHNPKILERLNEVERMMGTEFNLECANSQYDTFDYTNKPIKFSWWIRFGSADMPVGLLNHCIDYPENNCINFSFVTWVEDEQLLRLCEPLREKLEEISNRIPGDKMETITTQTQGIANIEHNPQAFSNGRYAIHLNDYINWEHINQLIKELNATNPLLTRSYNGFVYLTADNFHSLTDKIEKARELNSVDSYKDCELIHINHWLFTEISYHF